MWAHLILKTILVAIPEVSHPKRKTHNFQQVSLDVTGAKKAMSVGILAMGVKKFYEMHKLVMPLKYKKKAVAKHNYIKYHVWRVFVRVVLYMSSACLRNDCKAALASNIAQH